MMTKDKVEYLVGDERIYTETINPYDKMSPVLSLSCLDSTNACICKSISTFKIG